MAKLTLLPAQAIIDGFKGTIDYYVHDGVPCARAWPKSPGKIRSAAVMAQWPAFAYAAKAWSTLDPDTQAIYNDMAAGTAFTGKDVFTKAYLSGIDYGEP